ncbi:helix-turn-helix domain-containing protein [Enterococcus raffinosus]|uniref:helix-turn-helix domain-containing protein n=1 Tax=Enterococcus raffinosus TaxID=71452 RepID=UPI001C128B9E|nr:helix-turn-helix transcriptional regulator [Enterococcus raffinosus]MBU5362459.1 helix-turn-helix domain-containing protein [Enterococcus raffinosus]
MDIGSRLKKHRLAKEFIQEDVAKKLNVSRATISSWETGRTFPDIEKLVYLSNLYDLSLDQLIKEEPVIMETIVKERKSLQYFKIIKRIGIVLLAVFVLYNIYWFSAVYTKNKNLAHWQHTEVNNYLEKGDYTFQAHDLRYLEPLHNGNIPVHTYKGGSFHVGIDGDYIYVALYEPAGRTNLDVPKDTNFFLRYKKSEKNDLSYEKLSGDTPTTEAKAIMKKYRKELNKDIQATEVVWKEVNNK